MKTNAFFSTLLSLSALFISSSATAADIRQNPVTETRDVRNFSGIISNLPADVFVMQGAEFKVEATGPADVLAALRTEVKDGLLYVSFTQELHNTDGLVINVTMPAIERLAVNNNGDIVVQTELKTEKLTLSVSGTGDIALTHLAATTLEATVAGTGNIRTGQSKTEKASLSIVGTGNISMAQLEAKDCQANISGRGDIHIHVDKTLNANISGTGKVEYTGAPSIEHTVTGRGAVSAATK